jgi:hypothetical protein
MAAVRRLKRELAPTVRPALVKPAVPVPRKRLMEALPTLSAADEGCYAYKKMTLAQAVRIQRELVPGSGCVQDGQPFRTYGIWVLPFSQRGKGQTVFLINRPMASEADHKTTMEEAVQKLREILSGSICSMRSCTSTRTIRPSHVILTAPNFSNDSSFSTNEPDGIVKARFSSESNAANGLMTRYVATRFRTRIHLNQPCS